SELPVHRERRTDVPVAGGVAPGTTRGGRGAAAAAGVSGGRPRGDARAAMTYGSAAHRPRARRPADELLVPSASRAAYSRRRLEPTLLPTCQQRVGDENGCRRRVVRRPAVRV